MIIERNKGNKASISFDKLYINNDIHTFNDNTQSVERIASRTSFPLRAYPLTIDDSLTNKAKCHVDHPLPMTTFLRWSPTIFPLIVRTSPRMTTLRANQLSHRNLAKANT
ncbi:hypothetical protein DPMN_160399 [Dreissena polymorpha]|uniref:Uncharacterized protein n=1 Tax=Dreissena polymorpha TaxID=45954 RepID=A0A9D4EKQ4_DREPO|nr:hypothetical protein DPMN_160399 [Dreissena polymorpha]